MTGSNASTVSESRDAICDFTRVDRNRAKNVVPGVCKKVSVWQRGYAGISRPARSTACPGPLDQWAYQCPGWRRQT